MPTIGTVTLQLKQSRLSKELESGESKASLFCNCGIPGGIICGLMKEEEKPCSFVDAREDEAGLQTKKNSENSSVGSVCANGSH
jgi:hypothetical protein